MLSVVIPVFNEQDVLPLLVPRLRAVMGEGDEVLFVDDGSTDATAAVLEGITREWPQVRVVALARNGGHQVALTAGLERARGDWVVTMDADLQDPPELIPELLEVAHREGVDVVYASRGDRSSDSWFKRTTAGAYYRVVERLTGVPVVRQAGDFRLLSRAVITSLQSLPERKRVYRLLIPMLGFDSAVVHHRRERRAAGKTSYSLRRMALLAGDSVVSFSSTPLRLATGLGLVAATVSALLGVWVVIVNVTGNAVPGWASITLGVLFLGTVQLLCLGVLGEYVGRVYDEVKARPLYRVKGEVPGATCPTCGAVSPTTSPR
ncbi:MAG TPA: glycosyltransferase family 2 protein [Mycobacteriales bacterium]|nr:glycosyltransferase family 2 protein [Mycobacteriales bacterium]